MIDPHDLPLSPDEIKAAGIRADSERLEALRASRDANLRGNEQRALEVAQAWKPLGLPR